MSGFKVGDVVECIYNDNYPDMELGKTYGIIAVSNNIEIRFNRNMKYYSCKNFKLIKPVGLEFKVGDRVKFIIGSTDTYTIATIFHGLIQLENCEAFYRPDKFELAPIKLGAKVKYDGNEYIITKVGPFQWVQIERTVIESRIVLGSGVTPI